MKSLTLLIISILLCSSLFMPLVAAEQTRDMDVVFYVQSNPNLKYTQVLNVANITDEKYTNWNATVRPFMENNTDIKGRTLIPLTFPHIFDLPATNNIALSQYIRFSPEQVMNGASEFWVRVPVENLATNAIINVRLYRTWVSSMSFWVSHDAAGPHYVSGTRLIYNMTDTSDPANHIYHDCVRNHTVNLLDHTLNFTWVKISAPIIPKDNYVIYMNITNITNDVKLAVTACDLADDDIYRSALFTDDNNVEMDMDLDMPVIFTVGMGGGVSGARCDITNNTYNYFYWMHNRTVGRMIKNATGANLTYIVPYITNETENITFGVLVYQNMTLVTTHVLTHNDVRGKQFVCGYVDMTGLMPGPAGLYISHVVLFIRINATNATNLRIFLATETDTQTDGLQVYGFFGNAILPGVMWYSVHGFSTFGYLEFENSYWDNIQAQFILMEYEEPTTTIGILRIYQRMQMALYTDDGNHIGFWDLVAWGADMFLSLLIPAYLVVKHWEEVKGAALELLTVLFGDAAVSFGISIWQNITASIPALVALGFISAKAFYGIMITLVYFIFISSCVLVCECSLSWARAWPNGGFAAFTATLNNGWPRVWFMIDLLIKLVTIALIIMNSIYGIIKFW